MQITLVPVLSLLPRSAVKTVLVLNINIIRCSVLSGLGWVVQCLVVHNLHQCQGSRYCCKSCLFCSRASCPRSQLQWLQAGATPSPSPSLTLPVLLWKLR